MPPEVKLLCFANKQKPVIFPFKVRSGVSRTVPQGVPKYGRYKYSLFANYAQKCVVIVLIGWLPVSKMPDANQRLWIAYLLFSLFNMFDFSNVIENCTQTISPNPQERLWVRTWPVKISHLLENIFEFIIPLIGIGFADIRLYKYVVPAVFIPDRKSVV